MDTEIKVDSVDLSSVENYAEAIQRVSAGQFTSRFNENAKRFFASIFGAPFFALSTFAHEAIAANDEGILVISSDPAHAADGGRWWSLYSKALRPSKVSLTICFPHKPPSGRAPKPLLFQPPQPLVKNWQKHLHALSSPPSLVIFYPSDFDELKTAAGEFIQRAPGRRVLVSCYTRLECLVARSLLISHGYTASDVVCFNLQKDEPQHFALGAWWFCAVTPSEESSQSPDRDLVDRLRLSSRQLTRVFLQAGGVEERTRVAKVIATRTADIVDGQSVKTVRLSDTSGIDLESGRFFRVKEEDGGSGLTWDETVMSADLLALQPSATSGTPEDDDRLALLLWLSHAADQEAKRELDQLTGSDAAPQRDAMPSDLPEPTSSAPPDDPPASIEGTKVASLSKSAEAPSVESTAASAPATEHDSGSAKVVPSTPSQGRSRLSRSAGAVNVLALAAVLGHEGDATAKSFAAAQAQILGWLQDSGFALERPEENSHVESPAGEVSVETDGQTIWAMRFDNRSTMETGAIWRVEATLIGHPVAAISLRLIQVRSNEDAPPPVISGVPRLVANIAERVGLQDAGEQLRNTALRLTQDGGNKLLARLLLNAHRTQPVIVISGDVDASADRLAKRLTGVAHVVCIDKAVSTQMIRALGRERSVFGNAVRLYRPGFSAAANPYQHPTWPLKGTQLPKWLANNIFEEACAISLEAGDLDERAPSFQTVRNLLGNKRMASSERRISELRQQAERAATSKDEKILQLQQMRDEQDDVLGMYREENDKLTQESEQLKRDLQAALLERDTALEEVRQLNYRLNNQWADEVLPEESLPEESYYPDNWDELEMWVDEYGSSKLVLHPKAAKAARESSYKNIPLAYQAMEWLVQHYIPMRTRMPDDDETYERCQQALDALGLEESSVGTAKTIKRYKAEYKRQYAGGTVTLDRHLSDRNGDPATLFRLYFHYDVAAQKVLIGHLPTHLTNRLTHQG